MKCKAKQKFIRDISRPLANGKNIYSTNACTMAAIAKQNKKTHTRTKQKKYWKHCLIWHWMLCKQGTIAAPVQKLTISHKVFLPLKCVVNINGYQTGVQIFYHLDSAQNTRDAVKINL